jgi:hypothetical protein
VGSSRGGGPMGLVRSGSGVTKMSPSLEKKLCWEDPDSCSDSDRRSGWWNLQLAPNLHIPLCM